ncbi:unnamed protein product [Sphenostylis stenocarpa]|uniref:LOB domain-containing protein n=1 Tax=Sphenostylis stenocarpa TaxID=92480 RepID=A0AA86W4F7_9FABA|nr:unnamed protein product [Sphenostylis stenocarpa]
MSEEHRSVACVLCRYQHTRHDGRCELGQYFPINRSVDFEKACRLFGLANLLRLMRSAEPSERQVMADSILTEAIMWDNDPIHGALGHAFTLNAQIQSVERELELVNTILAQCSNQATGHGNHGSKRNNETGASTSQISNTGLDVAATSSEPVQSRSDEKEGAAHDEVQEKE